MKELLRRHSFSIPFLVILIGGIFLFSDDDAEIQRLGGFTMGTTYLLQLVDGPAAMDREQLAAEVRSLLAELDRGVFSTYAADSELSRLNRHPVDVPFIASAELMEVLVLARELNRLSDGAFDVTVGPLVNLWGFGPGVGANSQRVPSATQIDAALQRVGSDFLQLDVERSSISKTRDVYVDLSGIAKGYAVDRVATFLEERGVENYFLEIGGELKIRGLKPGNESWVPAIEAPLDTSSQVYEIFYNRGDTIAVAGSGDYRNYFEAEGRRYSHEIDPRSGRPIEHKLAAAYVIDESAARADGLATAYMILGPERARELIEAQGQAAYLISKSGDGFDAYVSAAFRPYLND